MIGIDSNTLAHNLLIDAVQEIVEASTSTLKTITQGLGSYKANKYTKLVDAEIINKPRLGAATIRHEDADKVKQMINKFKQSK